MTEETDNNPYFPADAKITAVEEVAPNTRLLTLAQKAVRDWVPGQFVEISLPGWGEAPFGITSSPLDGEVQICVRAMGNVSTKLNALSTGDTIGIRGPFGNGFEWKRVRGRNLLIVAGGMGLVPIRPLIRYIGKRSKEFGDVTILYGSKSQSELLFRNEFGNWDKFSKFLVTIDKDDKTSEWAGNVGLITTLFGKTEIKKDAVAVVCGPPVMYRFVVAEILKKEIPEDRILLSLERRMKCGVGKCQHCAIGPKYCCTDGPVFPYSELKTIGGSI